MSASSHSSAPGAADTLQGLRTHRPSVTPTQAEDLARALYGLEGEATPLPGERNENFLLQGAGDRALVLKISGSGEPLAALALELAALAHLAHVDPELPVPRVLPTRDGQPWAALDGALLGRRAWAVSLLPGRPLQDAGPVGPALRARLGEQLARLGRALRGFHHPWTPAELAWDLRCAPRLRALAALIERPPVRALVERIYDRFIDTALPLYPRLRCQFIHADAHPGNVLVDGDPPAPSGLLDFGDMVHGPLVLDPAVAAADLLERGEDALETAAELLAGYARVTPLESEEPALFLEAMLARQATALTIAAWRRRHDPEGVGALAPFEAAYESAARALLELDREQALQRLRAAAQRPAAPACNEDGAHPPLGRPRGGQPPADPAAAHASPAGQSPEGLIARRHRRLGRHLSLTYDRPLHLVRGEGVWMYDPTGRPYLDVYNNVPHVGHCHPRVVEAVARQTATLNTNTRYLHENVLEYAERLSATLPAGLEVCAFVNSGSEANDLAWRISRWWTRAGGALVIEHAYHGITEATAALSPYEAQAARLAPHVRTLEAPDTFRGRYGREQADAGPRYAEDVDRAIASLARAGLAPAQLVVDTGLTSHGILEAPPGYLAAAAAKVRAGGGLFVADEVQYGFGRSGTHFWGHGVHGVEPDLVVLGKPIGNGYPLGAVVTRRELLEAFLGATDFFSTFGGNPVAAAAGLAVLEVLEQEGLQENARLTGAYLRRGLEGLMPRFEAIGEVRGSGLLLGVDIVRDRASRAPDKVGARRLQNQLRDLGVLTGTEGPHGNVLKLRPPMCFRPEHADLVVEALGRALGQDS